MWFERAKIKAVFYLFEDDLITLESFLSFFVFPFLKISFDSHCDFNG